MADLFKESTSHTKHNTGTLDKYELIEIVRHSIMEFSNQIIAAVKGQVVLEVGPPHIQHIERRYHKYFVDTSKILSEFNTYMTCDIDPTVKPTYLCSVLDLEEHVKPMTFDSIILIDVLEHVNRVWEVPSILSHLLKPQGTVYFSTPFFFIYHDPKPDYWRLTRDSIKFLFNPFFDLHLHKVLLKQDDGDTPVHLRCVGKRR